VKSKPKAGKSAKSAARAPRNARKEVEIIDPDDVDDDEEDLEIEDIDGDEVELERAAAELDAGGGGRVYPTKLEPKEDAGKCDSYLVAEYSIERLRADWGDGKYAIVIRRSDGPIFRRGVVQLAKRAARAVATPAFDVVQIRREAREELQASLAPMTSMMQQAFTALAGRPAPASADPLQMLEALARMQKLNDRGNPRRELLEDLRLVKEIAGDGGSSTGAGPADVIVKLIEKFDAHPSPPAPTAPAAPAAPSREQAMTPIQRAIAQRIPIFLRAAVQGSDPGTYAQLVIDQLDDNLLAIVAVQLKREDWWAQLIDLVPDVRLHEAWFTALRAEILRTIETAAAPAG